MRYVVVGTAGHIDHGKTALVRSLTGIDTDRFKEEKERGITIDIGFANLDLDDGTRIGFVDVPGHERFVKNMLAGIGGIDMVMLVVAADESVMPQTREHLEICSLLRIPLGFTVITKVDTVEEELVDLVEMEVRDYLKGSFLADAPVVRSSAVTGAGTGDLLRTLAEISSRVRDRDAARVFRLPIDRCFTMRGFGTVVTGTLVSGSVRKDDAVQLMPSGRETRVRGVQVHGQTVNRAEAGQRTALNLQGVDVSEVERGMVLTLPSMLEATSMVDCRLELLESAPKAVTRRKRIRFHAGTSEIMGHVHLLGQERLEPGASAFAQIRLERETLVMPGDRFILRQYSPMTTIGGGQVLDVGVGKHRLKEVGVGRRLRALEDAALPDRVLTMVNDAGLSPVPVAGLVSRIGSTPESVRVVLEGLAAGGQVRWIAETPSAVVSEDHFQSACAMVLASIESFHEANPLAHGMSREAVQSEALTGADAAVLGTILDTLFEEQKLEASNEIIRAYGRRVRLTPEEQEACDSIRAALKAHGLEVPPADEVLSGLKIASTAARKIVQFMAREGVLAKVNEELLVDQEVMDGAIARLRERKKSNANLSVGDFKDLVGVTRKYAIPLLEYFDRIRVTRRSGSDRVIL